MYVAYYNMPVFFYYSTDVLIILIGSYAKKEIEKDIMGK